MVLIATVLATDVVVMTHLRRLVQNTLDTAGRAKPGHETDILVACPWGS